MRLGWLRQHALNAHAQHSITTAIAAATGQPFHVVSVNAASGGCVHSAARFTDTGGRSFFVKWNAAAQHPVFAGEAAGLHALAQTKTLRVPTPIAHGHNTTLAWLILEWLPLQANGDATALGHGLAALHRIQAPTFGGRFDNHIGATPQTNQAAGAAASNWGVFWQTRRLGVQAGLAQADQAPSSLLAALEDVITSTPDLLTGHQPVPSLLHGDLWSGNVAYSAGTPVVFDPAVYYGDRETDLAMSELFGGFPARFYAAYREIWPLDAGYPVRRAVYNLYHLLNHGHLFGGGYWQQAEQVCRRLLASLRG